MPVASAKDSAVVEAAATRATNAAIAPVLSVLLADVDASAGDVVLVLDKGAEALRGGAAIDGAFWTNVGAEVDQRPDVDADVLDEAGAAAGVVEAEPVALVDGVATADVGAVCDERPAEDAVAAAGVGGEEALADELPGRVGRGGGFAAGGGDAAGAGRGGGTVGIATFEIGLLTVAARGVVLGPAADGVAGRLTPGEPAVAPEGRCAAGECDADAGD
jgi:hypothetical protein